MKISFLFLLLVAIGFQSTGQTFEGSSNPVKVTVKAREGANSDIQKGYKVKPNGKFFALLIGVSEYDHSELNLAKPVKDAENLAMILSGNYTFEENNIKILRSPTRSEILQELFAYRKLIGLNDNLLIFYAGHGYKDEASEQGYWWPRDSRPDNPANWLSNSDLVEQIRAIKSGHTLLISDACFSGGIFKTRDVSGLKDAAIEIQKLYSLPSRQAITSGTGKEKVKDESAFIKYLITRLTENTESNLPLEKLFGSLKEAVIANSLNVPQIGVLQDTGHEGGDFIFIRKN